MSYTRFHTTALCSPTRQALLTGRNHHSVGMGGITEIATAAPGYSSVLPNTKAPLALTLKLNGYSTAQFGKCHEVPVWQTSPAGPFTTWPTGGGGFEYFYGFIGGENNQWDPALYEGTTPIEPPKTPERGLPPHRRPHRQGDQLGAPAEGAAARQAVLHVLRAGRHARAAPRPQGVDRQVQGKFAHGWDEQREITFERQKELGVIPADAELTPRHAEIPAWDDMDPRAQAGPRARDGGVRRLHGAHRPPRRPAARRARGPGILDDTLIYLIIGDNGASAEGTLQGAFNEMANFNGMAALETPEFMISKLDELGGPESYNHYAVGWAWAMDTPYQWTKQVASHWGGTRNGTIVHWPEGIKAKGEMRQQFTHVIDVAPTVLEAAGHPRADDGQRGHAEPLRGHEHALQLRRRRMRPNATTLQYFEMFGNRGIYYKGWSAVTKHRTPWRSAALPAFDDDVWELYDGSKD